LFASEVELMRLHVEALYAHDARSRIVSSHEWRPGPAPRFFLGRTSAGHVWRFRADVPDDLVARLKALCSDEAVSSVPPRAPVQHDAFVRALESHTSIAKIWMGPAYAFSSDAPSSADCVAITAANADLLRGGLDDWLEDVPHRQPFVAILEKGRAVSICASVRITGAAHEAGVETLPAARRRGHAVSVVAAWARAVKQIGALPLYSTSWGNVASQSVAAKLGLSHFGVDFHVS
jgi:hypothetical protein